jgi:hypothetical protein
LSGAKPDSVMAFIIQTIACLRKLNRTGFTPRGALKKNAQLKEFF